MRSRCTLPLTVIFIQIKPATSDCQNQTYAHTHTHTHIEREHKDPLALSLQDMPKNVLDSETLEKKVETPVVPPRLRRQPGRYAE